MAFLKSVYAKTTAHIKDRKDIDDMRNHIFELAEAATDLQGYVKPDEARISHLVMSSLSQNKTAHVNGYLKNINLALTSWPKMRQQVKEIQKLDQRCYALLNKYNRWLTPLTILFITPIVTVLWEGSILDYITVTFCSLNLAGQLKNTYKTRRNIIRAENAITQIDELISSRQELKVIFDREIEQAQELLPVARTTSGMTYMKRDTNLIENGYLCETCLDPVDGSTVDARRTCNKCDEDIETYKDYLPTV